ncbi:MAG: hypothetical protein FD146_588 [Anaerolineaceae bacterium]|nr:MAG: hypothetical protein FD146_588 [Anaerolineaceae bacterium]
MVKRSTWLWLVLFLAAAGVLLFLKYRPAPEVEPTPTAVVAVSNYLFTEEDGTLVRIRIYDRQYNIVMLERPAGGLWTMVLPAPGPADLAHAEAGATQIFALEIVDTVKNPQSLSSMGLGSPAYVMKLTFQSGIEHKLEIGDKTPSGSGYYARLDKGTVYIIGPHGIDALLNLHANPPSLPPTSTPVPPTPTPDPGATLPPVTPTP